MMTLTRRVREFVRAYPRVTAATMLVLGAALGLAWLRFGPIDPALLDLSDSSSTVVVDRRGVPLYEALSGDGTRSVDLAPDNLPAALVDATLAAEDRRFWSHPGIDVFAVARAMRANLAERRIVEGGSTITQQVAKLLLLRRDPHRSRGIVEKIQEAVLALRLEHRFGKREILAMYLNLAAFGNQIVGAERASRAYFGRPAAMLTTAQAAFLAGLPQRPSRFNPYRNRELAISRQRAVLRRMERAGFVDAGELRAALDERLAFEEPGAPFLAPHFVEMVLAESGDARPARIETTIDARLQADIAGIIRAERPVLERHGAANVAVVVLDNRRGEWLAWEGSGNYFDGERGGAINGPLTPRQPGSALKPFTYALAFDSGVTPATVLPDIPSHFPTSEPGVLYSPRNYDGQFRGPLLARRALAGSENVPAVALASRLGVPALLRFLTRAGFTSLDRTPAHYGLGVTLGNAEVRLDELVAAYAAFARGGEWIEPTWSLAGSGQRETRRLMSPLAAYWVTDILADAEAREYIFGRGGSLDFPFPVAVKTGTSQAYHDNWTVGYTRDVTVGVWVGNFDRTPLRDSSGVTGAGPIFHSVMLAAVRRLEGSAQHVRPVTIVPRPDGLAEREICALSGMTANAWCPARRREALLPGDDLPCSWHHRSDEGVLVVWPQEYRQWARNEGLLNPTLRLAATTPTGALRADESRSVAADARRPPVPAPAIEIVNPPSGATYLIDPTLRREFQTLALRVSTPRPVRVDWTVNDTPLGSSSSEEPMLWPLVPGSHRIAVRDTQGRSAEVRITVK